MQGKSEPSAASGLLVNDDFPYGTGVFIIMCALPIVASPKTASVDAVKCMLAKRVFVPDEIVCGIFCTFGLNVRMSVFMP